MSEPRQKPGRSCQTYGTPPEFLTAVRWLLEIDDFALDVASSHENAICPAHLTVTEDGLTAPWAARGWNFCNPPFGDIGPWVDRAMREQRFGHQTAVLIPASVGSNWWKRFVHNRAHVLFLNGRLQFVGATDPYPRDLALLLYSGLWLADYDVWTWRRYVERDERVEVTA